MPIKQAVFDTAYTYVKNSIKIMVTLIPGVPNEAKTIEPILDIVFSNLKWAGLFKENLTIGQQVELRKAIKKAFKEIEKKIPPNKRELLERSRPKIETITEKLKNLFYPEITDEIESILAQPDQFLYQ